MRFPFGESLTVRRWTQWEVGAPVGDPAVHTLSGVAVSPLTDDTDLAGRRGYGVPHFILYGEIDVDLELYDLVTRSDGAALVVTRTADRWLHPMTGWRAGATIALTELVDRGPESVMVYPSTETTDVYGDITRGPAADGVRVDRVTVEPVVAGENTTAGQDARAQWRVTGKGLEVLDAFAEVEWPVGSGQRFDVIGVPTRWPWPPSAPYTQATIRER